MEIKINVWLEMKIRTECLAEIQRKFFMLLGWFCSAFVVKKWRVTKMFCRAPSNKR